MNRQPVTQLEISMSESLSRSWVAIAYYLGHPQGPTIQDIVVMQFYTQLAKAFLKRKMNP